MDLQGLNSSRRFQLHAREHLQKPALKHVQSHALHTHTRTCTAHLTHTHVTRTHSTHSHVTRTHVTRRHIQRHTHILMHIHKEALLVTGCLSSRNAMPIRKRPAGCSVQKKVGAQEVCLSMWFAASSSQLTNKLLLQPSPGQEGKQTPPRHRNS